MVTFHPSEGHPPTLGWSPTRRKCTSNMEFGTYTLLSKLTLGDNCHRWSPTIHRMVLTNLRMVSDHWSPTRRKCKLYLTHKTKTNCHGWSPTIPRRVTCQPEDGHTVWPGLTPFGLGCPCLAPMGPVWPCLTLFGPVWSPVSICSRFTPFGTVFPIWLRLDWFGLVWPV